MIQIQYPDSFDQFRDVARSLLEDAISPADIFWGDDKDGVRAPLQLAARELKRKDEVFLSSYRLEWLRLISLHEDNSKWALLYKLMWRFQTEPGLFKMHDDVEITKATNLICQVKRDIYKMQLLLRFHEVPSQQFGRRKLAAWYDSSYCIISEVVKYFFRTHQDVDWEIVTPHGAAEWDGQALRYTRQTVRSLHKGESFDEWWHGYLRRKCELPQNESGFVHITLSDQKGIGPRLTEIRPQTVGSSFRSLKFTYRNTVSSASNVVSISSFRAKRSNEHGNRVPKTMPLPLAS